jgi:hypothetical protein
MDHENEAGDAEQLTPSPQRQGLFMEGVVKDCAVSTQLPIGQGEAVTVDLYAAENQAVALVSILAADLSGIEAEARRVNG